MAGLNQSFQHFSKILCDGCDFISNLPKGSSQALQKEIQKKFGLVGKRELRETDVLILRVSGRDTRAFKPGNGNLDMARSSKVFTNGTETRIYVNSSLYRLQRTLEGYFQLPILDETGLTNRYDFSLTTPDSGTVNTQTFKQAMREALHNQLGLELVPSRETIEMLVVRKVGK